MNPTLFDLSEANIRDPNQPVTAAEVEAFGERLRDGIIADIMTVLPSMLAAAAASTSPHIQSAEPAPQKEESTIMKWKRIVAAHNEKKALAKQDAVAQGDYFPVV